MESMELEPMLDVETQVKELIDKAVKVGDGGEAQRLTQAALNAAHAAQVLDLIDRSNRKQVGQP